MRGCQWRKPDTTAVAPPAASDNAAGTAAAAAGGSASRSRCRWLKAIEHLASARGLRRQPVHAGITTQLKQPAVPHRVKPCTGPVGSPSTFLVQVTACPSQVKPWCAAAALVSRHRRCKSELRRGRCRRIPRTAVDRLARVCAVNACRGGTARGLRLGHLLHGSRSEVAGVAAASGVDGIHLRRGVRVARHIHGQPVVDVARLRPQPLLDTPARNPRAAPSAGAAIAAVKLAHEIAPYIGLVVSLMTRRHALCRLAICAQRAVLGHEHVVHDDGLAAGALQADRVPVVDDSKCPRGG